MLNGNLICKRTGAACDFIIVGADMREVAEWTLMNTDADRVYFYGADRPVHVSHSSTPACQFVEVFEKLVQNKTRPMPHVVPNHKLRYSKRV